MKIFFSVLFIILCLVQCEEQPGPKVDIKKKIDEIRGVTTLQPGDSQILALKDTAQKYLPEFIGSVQLYGDDENYGHLVKSDFADGDKHEHMWSEVISYRDAIFTCVLKDVAYNLNNIHKGDTVNVKSNQVEDWVILDDAMQSRRGYFSEKYLEGKD